jgi:hypothetical protein
MTLWRREKSPALLEIESRVYSPWPVAMPTENISEINIYLMFIQYVIIMSLAGVFKHQTPKVISNNNLSFFTHNFLQSSYSGYVNK